MNAPFPVPTKPAGAKSPGALMLAKSADPMSTVFAFGETILRSQMFGCKNIGEANVIAWSLLVSGKDPLVLCQRNDIIKGKLAMKTGAMISDFVRAGGKFKILQRTTEVASIELRYNGEKHVFTFSWEDCQKEDYVWSADANAGRAPKYLKNGELNVKAMKPNYKTPRGRMQMLWNRVVSDGVRTIAPDVCFSIYSPDELGGEEPEDGVIDAEYEVEVEAEAVFGSLQGNANEQSTSSTGTANVEPTETQEEVVDEQVVETLVDQDEPTGDSSEATPASEPERIPNNPQGPATESQLQELRKYKDLIGLNGDVWKTLVGRYGVNSAKHLSWEQADELTSRLMRDYRQYAGQQALEEFSFETNGVQA